jgi:2-polyprenyl-3-methyl-5-hydroxy-6-metoxy-1,4-benzoquinol methylase
MSSEHSGAFSTKAGSREMGLEITPEVVRWAYRLFLDRDPENEAAVEEKVETYRSISDLRSTFLYSEEFRSKNPASPTLSGHEPPITVDLSISDEALQEIFTHIQSSWTSLGSDDPYFSVLTRLKFWKKHISRERIDEFYESGKQEAERLFKTLNRSAIDHTSFQQCLDFGCGIGRVSRWLSEEFETIFAYDVSKYYLKMAKKYLNTQEISNVEFRHVSSVDDLENFPKVDLIYSVIVLQHNPPPIIHRVIVQFMKALNPGGVAFFQVPTYKEEYRFLLEEYLGKGSPKEEMEMHVLPQKYIFEIVRKENGIVLEVLEDYSTSWGLSNAFLVQKI